MKIKIIAETGMTKSETPNQMIDEVSIKLGNGSRKDGFINRFNSDVSWGWRNNDNADVTIFFERDNFSYSEIDKLVARVKQIMDRIKKQYTKGETKVYYKTI